MKSSWTRWAFVGAVSISLAGCQEQPKPRERKVAPPASVGGGAAAPSTPEAAETKTAKATKAEGWGTIKGVIVFDGNAPAPKTLNIEKDVPYCVNAREQAGKGPIVDETLIVTESKGIKNAIVFMNVRGVPPIHPDYPQTKDDVAKADAETFKQTNGVGYDELESLSGNREKISALKGPNVLDQVYCQYVPHGFAIRAGQKVIALNYEDVAHNILVTSLANPSNLNMPPNTLLPYEWVPEAQPLDLKCSIHGWMHAYAMVFDHPYFDVTDDSGAFELKNVPAGEIDFVVRNPGFLVGGRSNPYKVTVNPDETVELEIKYDGTKATVTKK